MIFDQLTFNNTSRVEAQMFCDVTSQLLKLVTHVRTRTTLVRALLRENLVRNNVDHYVRTAE